MMYSGFSSQVGVAIADRRNELGLSQSYTAELAGISRRALQQIETGKANPTLNSLVGLLEVLGLQLTITTRTPNDHPLR